MPLLLDLPGGWRDLDPSIYAANNQVLEDHLVALNSLIRFAATADEYQYAGGVVGSLAGEVVALADGVTTTWTWSVAHGPIVAGTLILNAGAVIVADNGAGQFSGAGVTASSIDYATGRVSVTFAAAPAAGVLVANAYIAARSGQAVGGEAYGTGDGATVTFAHTAANVPVVPGSVVIRAGSVVATDNGSGQLTGAGVGTGTVNYASGAVSITFAAAPANGAPITLQYTVAVAGGQQLGTGVGTTTRFALNATATPIVPGTLVVAAGAAVGFDNGAGVIAGAGIAAGSAVNYTTGQIVVVFAGAPGTAAVPVPVVCAFVQARDVAEPFANGAVVPLPIGADDGYIYSRSECLYIFAMQATFDEATGANGGGGDILMLQAYVAQDTGAVECGVNYYVENGAQTNTADGTVAAIVACRRGAGAAMALAASTGGGSAGGGGGSTLVAGHGDPVSGGGEVSLS